MKQTEKKVLFWSGLTAMNSLFILALLWSVIPLGGETLPHVFEQILDISFPVSALLVSLFCALLATGTMVFMMLHPASGPVDKAERSRILRASAPSIFDQQEALRNEC